MSLVEAFVEAQKKFKPLKRSATNDHFGSKYSTLHDVLDAVLPALNEQGIALSQPIEEGVVYSRLLMGDEKMESGLQLPDAPNVQSLMSAITYFQRATLKTLCAIDGEDDDDDGNGAGDARPAARPQFRDRSRTIPVTAASQKQMDLIDRLVRDLKIDTLRDPFTQLVLDELPNSLSTAQASKLIDALQDAKKGQWPNGWINAPAGNRIDDGTEPWS